MHFLPIFQANEDALSECDVLLAVLDYALPEGTKLGLCQEGECSSSTLDWHLTTELNLPDNGTVWEMGYCRALGIPVIGFYPEPRAPEALNLMLSHGTEGIVLGWEKLDYFMGLGFAQVLIDDMGQEELCRAAQAHCPHLFDRAEYLRKTLWAKDYEPRDQYLRSVIRFDWNECHNFEGEVV
jgi:hypothetical protein